MKRVEVALEHVVLRQGEEDVQHGCRLETIEIQAERMHASLEPSRI